MRKYIYIANQSTQKLGGGFIFIENLKLGSENKCQFVDKWQDAHIMFIPSCTMIKREDVLAAKGQKRKIVLRIDNIPKDSRNRGTAFSRLKDFAQAADTIIFQSEWAKDYVGSWLSGQGVDLKKSHVIYNGVDTRFFHHNDDPKTRGETYLFTTFNTDENKRFPEAAYDFHLRHREAKKNKKPLPSLKLIGQFLNNLPEYKFDFFDGEKIQYFKAIEDRNEMANQFRSCRYLYFPAFADASPNTVSEAIACGCEILLANDVGGTKEVIREFSKRIITIQEMAQKYIEVM